MAGAAVGDLLRVAAVDADGVPTAWRTAAPPSGEVVLLDTGIEIPGETPVRSIELDLPEAAKTFDDYQVEMAFSRDSAVVTADTVVYLRVCNVLLAGTSNGNFKISGSRAVTHANLFADLRRGYVESLQNFNGPYTNTANASNITLRNTATYPEERNDKLGIYFKGDFAGTVSVHMIGYPGWR